VGFIVELIGEHVSLVLGRSAYTDAMPLLPHATVGVSPVMQMALVPPLVLGDPRRVSSDHGRGLLDFHQALLLQAGQ